MIKIFIPLLAIVVLTALPGCYKDKGNYDYHDINTILIKANQPDTINIFIQDTLKIDITLTETMPDPAGVSYDWVFYPSNTFSRRNLGSAQNLRTLITDAPGNYVLDFFVTDKKTQVSVMKRFIIKVMSVFNEGWLVIGDDGTKADLSMISPTDLVFHHIYSKANNNQPLPAGSHRVAVTRRRGEQNVYVLSPNGGTQINIGNFSKLSGFDDWFFIAPPVKKPQEYFLVGTSERLLIEGKIHSISLIAPAPYKFGLATTGNYYAAPFQMIDPVLGVLIYDTISQKFFAHSENDFELVPVAASNNTHPWNMNQVNKRLLFAGMNTGVDMKCVFKNNDNDSLFIYTATCRGVESKGTTIDTVGIHPAMRNASQYLMSKLLPHLYFVSGHQLFLYDIPAKTTRVVYTFPAGTGVRSMKMYLNTSNSGDLNNNRLVAVATQEAGEGKVYFFPIAATGDFTGNTYSKVFGGFQQINDITFKPTP